MAFLSVWLTSCGPGSEHARMKGKFAHVQNAELYMYCADGSQEGMDTLVVKGGKFKGDIEVTEPSLYTLLLQNFTEYSVILEPGATIIIDGDGQRLDEMEISGTPDNDLLTEFRLRTVGKKDGDVRRAAADFIRQHSKSLAAVAVLRDVFVRPQYTDVSQARQLLDVLRKAQPKCSALKYVEGALKSKMGATKGAMLPDFTATALDGSQVSTADLKGAPLLVCFTATWTQSYNEMWRALHIAKRDGPEGMRIVVISLDTDVQRLQQRLETDSLGAPVICDGKAFDSPLTATLGIRFLPTVMFVGSDGRIRDRDIDSRHLLDEIKKFR